MVPPRPIPPFPVPTPEAVATSMAMMADARQRKAAERPDRFPVLWCGPSLRDLEAAADCICSCHPRPADLGLHDGGVTCGCQLTTEERQAALASMWEQIEPLSETEMAEQAARVEAFEAAAADLGVTVEQWGGIAPFQIVGVVSGRAFYLRCRHGHWTVTVAGDDDPLGDPVPGRVTTFEIASGDEDDFSDGSGRPEAIVALHLAVQAVSDFVNRRTCAHAITYDIAKWSLNAVLFCPNCGVRLAEADRWRSPPSP